MIGDNKTIDSIFFTAAQLLSEIRSIMNGYFCDVIAGIINERRVSVIKLLHQLYFFV